ncbi:MAG TPA: hypothetical protein VEL51_18620 [Vicinamibacterales bacterium]|nr:hypothetical protein [Vicinamibacterales bacterium]
MRVLKGALLVFAVVTTAAAQSPEPPLADTRLTVHTLLREDVFAGFLDNNMERFAKAEQNIDALMKARPEQRANLMAWKAGTSLYRAVLAHESGNPAEFARFYAETCDGFAAAAKLSSGNDGVTAITGGSYAMFADRLPLEHRAAAWSQAYDSYSMLWQAQSAQVEQLPLHFKGELLAGMAQSAQRTGRNKESSQFVDKMLTLLSNTPFEKTAQQWKSDPASAATTSLTCKNCHNAGRLSARLAALNK